MYRAATKNAVVTDRSFLFRNVMVRTESETVVTTQSVKRSEPEKTVVVFNNRRYGLLRQAVVDRDNVELIVKLALFQSVTVKAQNGKQSQ